MSIHFQHNTANGSITIECNTYGDFMEFMAAGRILLNHHDVTMADWDYVAEHRLPPPESPESREARRRKLAEELAAEILQRLDAMGG